MDINLIFRDALSLIRQKFWTFALTGLPFIAFCFWYLPYSEDPYIDFFTPEDTYADFYSVAFLVLATSIYALLYVIAAVKCHMVFLHREDLALKDYFLLNKRHLRFFWASTKLMLIFMIIFLPVYWLWGRLMWDSDYGYEFDDTFLYLLILLISALWARFSLILPAAALGDTLSMVQSWRLTRQNRFTVFILVAALPTLTSQSLNHLHLLEYDFIGYLEIAIFGLVSLVELGLLSMCYRYYSNQLNNFETDKKIPTQGRDF